MRLDFFDKVKYQSSTVILSGGIKYSLPDVLDNTDLKRSDKGHIR